MVREATSNSMFGEDFVKVKILITGSSGFVASSFCKQFSNRNDLEIVGLTRRPEHRQNEILWDLRFPLDLNFIPDIFIHAAAKSSPWGTLEDFRKDNVQATRNVVDFCRAKQIKKLVYISSSSVYYRFEDQFDLTEKSPVGPKFASFYAQTKYEGEQIVKSLAETSATRVVILRPRAVFGPNDSVLFPRILKAALKGQMTSIQRPTGPALGDLIYIDSLCDYLLKAALEKDVNGDFNLTNNETIEIQSFLFEILQQLGLPKVTRKVSQKTAFRVATFLELFYKIFMPNIEPPITRFGVGVLSYSKTFDVSKSLAAFGAPTVSLAEGARRFVEWQKGQMQR